MSKIIKNNKGSVISKDLASEIINNKKQMVLKVDQDSNYVYPNELFEYQIYCHNISFDTIKNIHIQIISPENILIDEDDYNQGVPIGDLNQQESHLLRVKARCSSTGKYTVHFLCYGDGTGLFTRKLTINCDYNAHNEETTHRIHIYNFTPYEEKYMLQSQDYSENVTRLKKIQKLPYLAKQNPFSFIKQDPQNGFTIDESQLYLDQKDILYSDPVNTDEHNYQYIERENFNKGGIEYFEGRNLIDVLNQINDHSKFFNVKFLKTGTNRLLNDFKQYNPNGFFYRFGLMSSELFHYLGVLPEYSYMNDLLFRWAPDKNQPLNLYPKKVAMHWNTKKWAGHGYQVYKTYTDEYKEEIINNPDFKPLFELVGHFDLLSLAEEYISKEYEFDTTNIYYIEKEGEITSIRKYQYIIKESYFDNGVFYIHIPLDKIPSNFYIPSTEDIEAIVQKTKPFGMKPLIRYISTVRFNHNMSFKHHAVINPVIKLHLGEYDKLRYTIIPYKYNLVEETICTKDPNNPFQTRETIKLIPDGKIITNRFHFEQKPRINAYLDKPQNAQNIKMDMRFTNEPVEIQLENRLSYMSDLSDVLYQNNFENLSFTIDNIILSPAPSKRKIENIISATNYQLWVRSLEDENHSVIWSTEELNHNGFDADFIKLLLTNARLRQANIESGIGFKDSTGKLHGISAEYDPYLESFNIRYTTSKNDIFKVHKSIVSDVTGLAYHIVERNSKQMVLFFIEKDNQYHYFHHIIIPSIDDIFMFIRNDIDVSSIKDLSNIVFVSRKTDNPITFNTPQYLEKKEYDPNLILTDNINPWNNILRIDRNEHSYASIQNMGNDFQSVDDIDLHFDNINIPDDALVKRIDVHAILESNTNKSIYCCLRNQDGFVTKDSSINKLTLYPAEMENYPSTNNNTEYYEEQYKIAYNKNITNSIKILQQKINDNKNLNDALNLDLTFLNNIDDYITINRSFWCELSNFTDNVYHFNDIENVTFVMEGYNHGKEITLNALLCQNSTNAPKNEIKIPTGYFIKHIPLEYINNFDTKDIRLKFKFNNINTNVDIFDLHLDIDFKNKQNDNIPYEDYKIVDIEGKKTIDVNLIDEDYRGYQIKNGFTTTIQFDDLESGGYYRIYSIVVKVIYQSQSIDITANPINARNLDYENDFLILSGDVDAKYLSGAFYNDSPSVYQYDSTKNSEDQGIELSDTLYQSFVATQDNITSITLYPNGFVGNPDLNLKLGLYSNHGYTPGSLIKEVKVSGWSKENEYLKGREQITYNFNVNNLKIGETYWLKIEVENPIENSYYLLKYLNSPNSDFKLLSKINNNLINTYSVLKFQVNSIDLYKSFNNIPYSRDQLNNPNIFIGLNRGQGKISNLKIKKV